MNKLATIWGERLNAKSVLQEYPRPQLQRESYVNINGEWDYAITAADCKPEGWDGKILVPFSPEAPLSGVNRTLLPGQALWYHRTFSAVLQPGMRMILHFGAVDQQAKVYVNQKPVCEHIGGYTAFEADITDALTDGENELIVRVLDDTDSCQLSRGKQKTKRGGIWYTPQSGIWQTVWMECVPDNYVMRLELTPDFEGRRLRWKIYAPNPEGANVVVRFGGEVIVEDWADENGEGSSLIRPEYFRPWTPETPSLYDLTVKLEQDEVRSYFAMRSVGVGRNENGQPCLMLNGKPYFHHGVLDQGYWPDGLYTAPSDEALVYDIQTMKDLGFNMLRKHIKVESMRWYYHCDRLGMLVWQDMMSGGGAYNFWTVSSPLVTGLHKKDSDYQKFARTDSFAREHYYAELEEMVHQLYNCPSVVMWVPFNEGWGQFDAQKAVERIEAIDKTRTIDHASGWHDQRIGKIKSLHVYFKPYRFRRDRLDRAVVLSEFGGYNLPVRGHTWNGKNFGYRGYKSEEALGEALKKLYEQQILPAKEQGLAACVYTQLSDVEDEVNGFMTYDRKCVKLPRGLMREIRNLLLAR